MKKFLDWWNTSCQTCRTIRRFLIDLAQLALSLVTILFVFSAGLFVFWIFFDNEPAVRYGPNSRAEFNGDYIVFYLDAKRIRDCPTTIRRKIVGCGQIDLPQSFATTPVGESPSPVSYPLAILFQSFSREQLSGNVCYMVSQAEAYCNPAQKLMKMPVISQSQPIQFVPVPRTKTYGTPTP